MHPPGTERRGAALALVFASCVYDGLLCLAMLFVASAVAVALNAGEAVPAGTLLFEAALLAVPLPYFAWCWTRGGATLGMRAWRLRLGRDDGAPVRARDALLRYAGALLSLASFGLGFLWMLVDARGMSWHDRLSGTRVMREHAATARSAT